MTNITDQVLELQTPPPCWYIEYSNHGQITLRQDEADCAIANGAIRVTAYSPSIASVTTQQNGRCKDCKHWAHHIDQWNKQWHTCENADWVDYNAKIADDAIAVYADASDDSGLLSGLKTGSMFGCIKFCQKKA